MGISSRTTKVKGYTVVIEQEVEAGFEGYYNAWVPALPGCLTYGTSFEEAIRNATEAIEVYLEDVAAGGR